MSKRYGQRPKANGTRNKRCVSPARKGASRTSRRANGAHKSTGRARPRASAACTSRSRTRCDARIDVPALDRTLARHDQPVQAPLDRQSSRRPFRYVRKRQACRPHVPGVPPIVLSWVLLWRQRDPPTATAGSAPGVARDPFPVASRGLSRRRGFNFCFRHGQNREPEGALATLTSGTFP